MTDWTLQLPFEKALNMNDRGHWSVRAREAKAWRKATAVLARQAKVPPCPRVRVEMLFTPATVRRRDPDNLAYAFKFACDGLVDAGIVPDDTADYMERVFPVIAPAVKTVTGGRFVLRVTRLEPAVTS